MKGTDCLATTHPFPPWADSPGRALAIHTMSGGVLTQLVHPLAFESHPWSSSGLAVLHASKRAQLSPSSHLQKKLRVCIVTWVIFKDSEIISHFATKSNHGNFECCSLSEFSGFISEKILHGRPKRVSSLLSIKMSFGPEDTLHLHQGFCPIMSAQKAVSSAVLQISIN